MSHLSGLHEDIIALLFPFFVRFMWKIHRPDTLSPLLLESKIHINWRALYKHLFITSFYIELWRKIVDCWDSRTVKYWCSPGHWHLRKLRFVTLNISFRQSNRPKSKDLPFTITYDRKSNKGMFGILPWRTTRRDEGLFDCQKSCTFVISLKDESADSFGSSVN